MKRIALATTLIFMCINIFAQEEKLCLFIGIYNISKNGDCVNRAIEKETVQDYNQYLQKKAQFKSDHKNQNENARIIKSNESVIVYEYNKKVGKTCQSKLIGIIVRKTIEDCEKSLAGLIVKNPKEYASQPVIIYTWQGKGK